MDHISQHQSELRARMVALYAPSHIAFNEDTFIEKALGEDEKDLIQKGKPVAAIGTIKDIGGRPYMKTADGWKYHGKGTGAKAQEHAKGAKAHMGGGVAVGPGSHIVTKEGVRGAVKKVDDKHAHVEYSDTKGKTKTSKVPHEHMAKKIEGKEFTHYVPADKAASELKPEAKTESKESIAAVEKKATDENVDIKQRFKAFELFTKMVVTGKSKSMIAYGTGGVGKTYTVTKQFEEAGKQEFDEDHMKPGDEDYDYVKITGKATPTAVYKALYEHNGKILMFDDCDSVLKSPDAVNFFKGALDTSGDGTIAYGSSKKIKDDDGEDLPQRFKFTGRVVFISNLSNEEMPQPLKSRGLKVDLTMDKKQTIERIRQISQDPEGQYQNLKFPGISKYTHKELKAVVDYLDKHKDDIGDLNVRTVGKLLGIKQMAAEMGDHDWESYAEHEIFSKSKNMNTFDGNEILKARKANIAKSYGVVPTIKKSEDVTSKENVDITKGEDIDLMKGEKTTLEKAFDTLGL